MRNYLLLASLTLIALGTASPLAWGTVIAWSGFTLGVTVARILGGDGTWTAKEEARKDAEHAARMARLRELGVK